jgi:hypothetical protein
MRVDGRCRWWIERQRVRTAFAAASRRRAAQPRPRPRSSLRSCAQARRGAWRQRPRPPWHVAAALRKSRSRGSSWRRRRRRPCGGFPGMRRTRARERLLSIPLTPSLVDVGVPPMASRQCRDRQPHLMSVSQKVRRGCEMHGPPLGAPGTAPGSAGRSCEVGRFAERFGRWDPQLKMYPCTLPQLEKFARSSQARNSRSVPRLESKVAGACLRSAAPRQPDSGPVSAPARLRCGRR